MSKIISSGEYHNYEYIINNNQGLVYKIVNRFVVNEYLRDDLIQAGLMGLLDAARRFDLSKKIAFSTYATPFIIGNIKKEFSKQSLIAITPFFYNIITKTRKIIEEGITDVSKIAKICQTNMENIIVAISYIKNPTLVSVEQLEEVPGNNHNLYNMFSSLNNEEKRLLRLRVIENFNQREISELYNVSQSTISRKLKKIFEKMIS